jgi:hypothetical protein
VRSAPQAGLTGIQRALCWPAQALCRAAGEVVDATLKALNKDPEDDPPLDVVAGLYCDRTAGDVPPPLLPPYLSICCCDCCVAKVHASHPYVSALLRHLTLAV